MKYRKHPRYNWLSEDEDSYVLPWNREIGDIRTNFVEIVRAGSAQVLIVRKDYAWDGATCFPDIETIIRGSKFHDALYQLMRLGLLPQSYRETADKVLRDICLKSGMTPALAACVYRAVRVGAGRCARRKDEVPEILTAP